MAGSLRPTHHRLEEFVALASAQPEQALRFARRWGVLHLCARHQQPAGHASPNACPIGRRSRPGWEGSRWAEPVEAWRRWARRIQALLRISARLADGAPDELPSQEGRGDWVVLLADDVDQE